MKTENTNDVGSSSGEVKSRNAANMVIDLRPFYECDRVREIETEFDAENDEISGPVRFKGFIKSMAQLILLDGEVAFTVRTECAKCLSEVVRELTLPIRHYLVRELKSEQDDDEYILVENDMFSLDELLCEDIELSLPTRFLCREDCKGLCSECGKNLNEGPCTCKRAIDPRLQALAELLD